MSQCLSMDENHRAEWEAVAELVERWADGVAVVDDVVAIARHVDGVLVVEAAHLPELVHAR